MKFELKPYQPEIERNALVVKGFGYYGDADVNDYFTIRRQIVLPQDNHIVERYEITWMAEDNQVFTIVPLEDK